MGYSKLALARAPNIASPSTTAAFVAAGDHSDVMVGQATRRNAQAIAEGRVNLQLGSAS
jgi:hypothetical protein